MTWAVSHRRRMAAEPEPTVPESDFAAADFAADVQAGLSGQPKTLPSKYFYDAAGSALFEQICELPEYYPTRTELALLQSQAEVIAGTIGPDAELIEFGAGALRKVRLLLDALQSPRAYLPIDISGAHLAAQAETLARDYPDLAIMPIAADYTAALSMPPAAAGSRRRVGFFPGSTIGNFTPPEALGFLCHVAQILKGGNPAGAPPAGLLIGVDLVKAPEILHAAYNDAAGVTAAFNRNLLRRINDELGGDFDLDRFAHYAFYQPRLQRIEMHLVSLAAQTVRIGGERYGFAEGESIHTENSYKYTPDGFRRLARQAGFQPTALWCDPQKLFSLHWLTLPA
ncbi:MAG TPA: L-histidine N(alpha)-methyltransferase [Ferrovibrio sp.]|uniref:L-histidine N(alpha)-methyltransferase n=1 Tax=Ferrovibrio sp. TaxID=1917215 RepID=UPI002ED2C8C5